MRRVHGVLAGIATAILVSSAPAHAEPDAAAVDYDAPDPNRNGLTVARAFGNLLFENWVIWQIDWFRGTTWNPVTRDSIAHIVSSHFSFDYDPLSEDLFGHPLHGVLHYTSGRAAGLSFWESSLFPVLGSLVWETLGERQLEYPGGWRSKPSTNDFVASATMGPLLGEGLYRLSSAVLDDSKTGVERVLRELGASILSPMRGFNRLYTGDMWKKRAPPLKLHPLRLSLDAGADALHTWDGKSAQSYDPTMFVAAEIDYGDLLPKHDGTIGPLESFDAYVGGSFFGKDLDGVQVHAHGMLYGWSSDLSTDHGRRRDNNVVGVVQSFDYQGVNDVRFAAFGIGPADFIQWRFDGRRWLRLGIGAEWTYFGATPTPFPSDGKGYKFLMGGSLQESAHLELGPHGRFTARSQHYITGVVDGQGGAATIWYGRMSYDVDLVPCVGLGLAPTLVQRRSILGERSVTEGQVDLQLYLRVHD
jgi:hypothetical protein